MKTIPKSAQALRGKKVYVGLSGGVDSAVSAKLLKDAGAEITGVFIKGWYPEGMPCTWREDRLDAMRVAAHLQIPFMTLDASLEYKESVIEYLLKEYKSGRTPNPDIMCNKDVKFGAFYRYAMERGADYIATGHYAQATEDTNGSHLIRGVHEGKDQSYFLWAISKEALSKTIFPIGNLQKSEVRSLAKKYAFPNATKKDSQGICFLGDISIEQFLRKEFGTTYGVAENAQGISIGTHDGALLYTIGERVALTSAPAGPWYVIAKDIEKNILTVSHEVVSHTGTQESFSLIQTNFFRKIDRNEILSAQYRYHGPRIEGTYDETQNVFTPLRPLEERVAQSQSLVLYDAQGNECLGGGIIH
jgi:tRNA-uridine 2-sulfurtransferase